MECILILPTESSRQSEPIRRSSEVPRVGRRPSPIVSEASPLIKHPILILNINPKPDNNNKPTLLIFN